MQRAEVKDEMARTMFVDIWKQEKAGDDLTSGASLKCIDHKKK